MQFSKLSAIKNIFFVLIIAAVIIFIIHVVNAIIYSKKIEYITIPFKSGKVSPELDGYKLTFIVDTHQIPREHLEEIVNEINTNIKPDALLLGGDFPNHGAVYRTMETLGKADAKDGIFCVEGNHDIRLELIEATEQNDIKLLFNEGFPVAEGLFIGGVEDMWLGEPSAEAAFENAMPNDFKLLLSHNPDYSMQDNIGDIDLMLSGHTHGGHVTFFGLWAPALTLSSSITEYGQKFMSGMCEGKNGTPVYVSNGTGYFSSIIPRIFARPQVITVVLESNQN